MLCSTSGAGAGEWSRPLGVLSSRLVFALYKDVCPGHELAWQPSTSLLLLACALTERPAFRLPACLPAPAAEETRLQTASAAAALSTGGRGDPLGRASSLWQGEGLSKGE